MASVRTGPASLSPALIGGLLTQSQSLLGGVKMKYCTKCGETKPTTEYHKCASKRDGLLSNCKVCVNAANAKYRAANPEKVKAAISKWRAANRERVKERLAAYRGANLEPHRIREHTRRARKRESGGKLSKLLTDKLFRLQRGKCACGCKQPLGDDYHLDHIMPLALGGSNTDDNIQLLRATCNHQKSAKHPVDFMRQRGFLL